MLHAVRYVKAAGGIGRMLDVEGGAQQDRFPGGTQQIALKLADELGERVRLGAIVRRIDRNADGTFTVSSDGRRRHRQGGRRGDPARAPSGRSTSPPPCPPNTRNSRSTGRRGISARPTRPTTHRSGAQVAAAARHCPTKGRCSSHSTSAPTTTDQACCSASPIRAHSTHCHPPNVASLRWPGSPTCSARRHWSRSTTSTTVGAQRNSRQADRRPRCRPVRGPPTDRGCASRWRGSHWAGTETADEWTGFFDGAVRSGRRAAAEVHSELSS